MAQEPEVPDIKSIAREVIKDALAELGAEVEKKPRPGRELINESHVIAAREKGGVLEVPPGAIVTPLARDAAERFRVQLRAGASGGEAPRGLTPSGEGEAAEASPEAQGGGIALGSDHGGFKLKEAIKKHLASRGLALADVGTTSDSSCDYPDFAARVGRAISLGEARWGIFVDGAGIGGAMALNKMPGVFAATCHDPKAAQNARGHNRANVLCLGSGWVDDAKARAVVDAFLGTGFEGGRHAKRVAKIAALERAFVGGK